MEELMPELASRAHKEKSQFPVVQEVFLFSIRD